MAVLVPYYNDEVAVAKVVKDFCEALPDAAIFVSDNNSTDNTAAPGFAIPIFVTYIHTGLVPRLPTAVLSPGRMLLAFLSIAAGLVLDTAASAK